jgi:hypothetical protein
VGGPSIPVAVPLSRLGAQCDRFTREFAWGTDPVSVTVEVLSLEVGDQVPIRVATVRGLAFDPRTSALELSLEDGDHRVPGVREVWVAATPAGFVELLEVVRDDGVKEIWTFTRTRRRAARLLR